MQKKNALATVLFIALLSLPALTLLPLVTADIFMPPGPPTDMSEWIYEGLHVKDLQTMMDIGYMYTDGPSYDPETQEIKNKTHKENPEIEGITRIPFSTWVMVFGYIPGVVVSPDQTPPPVVLVIEWNGVPYAVTLEAPGPVGYQYPPEKYGDPCPHVPLPFQELYPCVETIYEWVYPTNGGPDGSWKYAYYNVWFGDFDGQDGQEYDDGLYFWYIFHPNAGDYIARNCDGKTKHPPTYDITAHLEYSTSTIWLNHKCFDVRLLEVHKEIEPDNINHPEFVGLSPIEDATVAQHAPNANFGSGSLYATSDSLYLCRAYLKFDISGLDLVTIDRARLWMYCNWDGFYGLLPVEIALTTDNWSENTLTWNNAPPPGPVVATTMVDGSGLSYMWEDPAFTQAVINEYIRDGTLSLVVKLQNDLTDRNYVPIRHRVFDGRDEFRPPRLFVRQRPPLDGGFEISNILTIKNVGKVPAPGMDFIESFPTEKDTAIIPKWDTATVKIFDSSPYDKYEGRHIYATPLALREGLIENGWPFHMPPPYDILYPGETMVISMEASVNVDEYWSGSFVIDAMVSSCVIAPWKYPRAFDILTIGTELTQESIESAIDEELVVPEGYEVVHEGLVLRGFFGPTGFRRYAWIAPSPVIRNPIPQTRNFEMVLDPPAVDLNGDDLIDSLDVELVRQAIVGLVAYDSRMDTNVNDKIDTQDLAAFKCAAES